MATVNHSGSIRIGRKQSPRRAGNLLRRLTGFVEAWIERRRQRHALRELSDHVLKDIGISRCEAEHEGRKPFWQA